MDQFARGDFHTVKYFGYTRAPELGEGLVMEYIGGGDLKTWLQHFNPRLNPGYLVSNQIRGFVSLSLKIEFWLRVKNIPVQKLLFRTIWTKDQ